MTKTLRFYWKTRQVKKSDRPSSKRLKMLTELEQRAIDGQAERFSKLKTDKERINFCRRVLPYPPIKFQQKSEEKALILKENGNVAYNEKRYLDALQLYNESMANAPAGSKTMAMVYANLSALYMVDGEKYLVALAYIEAALAHGGYPKDKVAKLKERQAFCQTRQLEETTKKMTLNDARSSKKVTLAYPAMKNNPALANCLKFSPTKERWIISASTNIKPGDVIVVEPAVFNCIGRGQRFLNCSSCLVTLKFLFPCPGCCDSLFCSKECQAEANASFHQYDCGLSWPIGPEPNCNQEKMFLRFFLAVLLKHFPTASSIQQLLEDVETNPMGFVDTDAANEAPEVRQIRIILSPKRRMFELKWKTKANICLSYAAVSQFRELLAKKSFADRFPTEKEREILQMALLKLTLTYCSCNVGSITVAGKQLETYCATLYPIRDSIEELQDDIKTPNCIEALKILPNDPSVIFALRPIKAGEKITLNATLKNTMMMPILNSMTIKKTNLEHLLDDIMLRLEPYIAGLPDGKLDMSHLEGKAKGTEKFVQFLIENERYRPCQELCYIEHMLAWGKMISLLFGE